MAALLPKVNSASQEAGPSIRVFTMRKILSGFRRFLTNDSGHTLVEYLFMLSLVIFAALLGIGVVGDSALDLFTRTKNALP